MSFLNTRFIHPTAYATFPLGNLPGISNAVFIEDLGLHMHTHTRTHTHTSILSPWFPILVNGTTVYSAHQARNLGVLLDSRLPLIPHSQHSPPYSALYFLILSSSLTLHCQAPPPSPYLDHSTNLLTCQQLSPLPLQSFLPSAAKVTSENAILTQYFSDWSPLVAFY